MDGTVGRDRRSVVTGITIWNTWQDPETFGKGNW
jgi:hypothetical protein